MRKFKIIFIISILLSLCFFINSTDLGKAVSSIHLVGGKFIIIMLTTFLAYFSAAIGWKFCFGEDGKKLSITNLFIIRHVGETVTLINPVGIIAGEIVKVLLLKDRGIEKKTVITSVLVSRMVMVATQIILFLVAVIFTSTGYSGIEFQVPRLSSIYIPLAIGIFFVAVIIKSRHRLIKIAEKSTFYLIVKDRIKNWRVQLTVILHETSQFFSTHKKALAWSSLFFVLHWIIGSLEFYFILKFLGIKITIMQSLFLDMGVVLFKSAGTFVPAQIGVEEYGNKVMLSLIGVAGAEIWITVSILKRFRQLCWIGLGLGLYLLIYKRHRDVLVNT